MDSDASFCGAVTVLWRFAAIFLILSTGCNYAETYEQIAVVDCFFYISNFLFAKVDHHMHRFETNFRLHLLSVSRQNSIRQQQTIANISVSFGIWQRYEKKILNFY